MESDDVVKQRGIVWVVVVIVDTLPSLRINLTWLGLTAPQILSLSDIWFDPN